MSLFIIVITCLIYIVCSFRCKELYELGDISSVATSVSTVCSVLLLIGGAENQLLACQVTTDLLAYYLLCPSPFYATDIISTNVYILHLTLWPSARSKPFFPLLFSICFSFPFSLWSCIQLQACMDAYTATIAAQTAPSAPLYPLTWLCRREMEEVRWFQDTPENANALLTHVAEGVWWRRAVKGLALWKRSRKNTLAMTSSP